MDLRQAVKKDSGVMSGEVVFTGTRVPVWMLFDHIRHGHCLDDFFVGYPGVTREQVEAILDTSLEVIRKTVEDSRAA